MSKTNTIQNSESEKIPWDKTPVFALDIGTRSVIGVVGVSEGQTFHVLGTAVEEHRTRSMLDGQIHDIDEVARVIRSVKQTLETQLGMPLERACIAAAGRVLKTRSVKISQEIDPAAPVNEALLQALEIEGIGLAQEELKQLMEEMGEPDLDFYCVGHSVTRTSLNGYTIANPLGHKGRVLGLDLLATFLPQIVVDSLHSALELSGLQASSLTLEPIAAIHVTIPRELRLLNLALIDVGAGTSDIAITREGSVVAYAMVPVAGDELTEAISREFIVSFETAEKMKRLLSTKRQAIAVTDILGFRRSVSRQAIAQLLGPEVERLAGRLARAITEQNAKSPNAVFLVGGGSQIPGLTEALAVSLGLDPGRVAVQSRKMLRNVRMKERTLSGPEAVTPLGIAVYSLQDSRKDFMTVTVNDRKARLFRSGNRITVSDALIMVGSATDELIARSGKSCRIEYNGNELVLRGTPGEPARILVNKELAHLDTELEEGAVVSLQPARRGTDALHRVRDLPGFPETGTVSLNGTEVELWPEIRINGRLAVADDWVEQADQVQVEREVRLEAFLELHEVHLPGQRFLVNGSVAPADWILRDGDRIETESQSGLSVPVPERLEPEDVFHPEHDWPLTVTVNGQPVRIDGDKTEYLFVDVFDHIPFDLKKPQGRIVLKLNGYKAAYTDPICEGDAIQVYWEK